METLKWRKSTYSSGNGAECVEVGSDSAVVAVRDTQDRNGSALIFIPAAWRRFTDQVKGSLAHDLTCPAGV